MVAILLRIVISKLLKKLMVIVVTTRALQGTHLKFDYIKVTGSDTDLLV